MQLIEPQDMKQMAALGIIASMQPIHAVSDRDMADKYWGDRCRNAYAWKSIIEAGVKLIFGSDAPVESPNPFWGLSAATERTSPGNLVSRDSWIPEQCLSSQEALNAYISSPWEAAGLGAQAGKLSVGCAADLLVIKENILESTSGVIPKIMPIACMTQGNWIYRKS